MKGRKRVLAGALAVVLLLGAGAYAATDLSILSPAGRMAQAETGTGAGTVDESANGGPKRLGSIDELLKFIPRESYYGYYEAVMEMSDVAAPEASVNDSDISLFSSESTLSGNANGGSSDYAETNSQVSGVEEGDLIKTDGQFIYSLQEDVVRIHKVNGSEIALASEIKQPQSRYVNEMFLAGDRLVTVAQDVYGFRAAEDYGPVKCGTKSFGSRWCTAYTVYDISDRTEPKEVKTFEIKGSSAMARVAEGKLYFVVNQYLPYISVDDLEPEPCEILPLYYDSQDYGSQDESEAGGDSVKTVPVQEICYFPEMETADSYMVVGLLDLLDDSKAVFDTYLSDGHDFYMSRESLYIVSSSWREYDKTKIYRFDVASEGLEYQAEGKVDGYVLNQYSMDEYDGYFRIATTQNGVGNFIRVLDRDLNTIGSTPALAEDETIHSVRFMGTMGYMVTYRQTDPLYAVDLSDPTDPQVLDALKIPGFSQYLHPVGDDLLVGFGRHTEEIYRKDLSGNEVVIGTTDMGAKVSLFDISDPKNLREIDVMFLGEESYAEAFDNPRALMVNRNKHYFGFFLEEYETYNPKAYKYDWKNTIRLIAVAGDKLVEMASIDVSENSRNIYGNRLVYIDETLYSLENGELNAYDMENGYRQIANVKF